MYCPSCRMIKELYLVQNEEYQVHVMARKCVYFLVNKVKASKLLFCLEGQN